MTEYSRRPMGVDPGVSINLAFAGAALDVAQHPSLGVAKVGARVVRNVLAGTMTPEQAARFEPTKRQLRAQLGVAAASHALAEVYGIPRASLNRTVPFVYDLVLNGVVQSGAQFANGAEGHVLPEISIPTEDEYGAYTELLADPVRARRFGSFLGRLTERLSNPMNPAQEVTDTYHATILDVSERYRGNPSDPGRMQELGQARDGFAHGMRTHLRGVMTLDELSAGGAVLVENVLRHNPSRALVDHHFAKPQV